MFNAKVVRTIPMQRTSFTPMWAHGAEDMFDTDP